MTTILTAHQPLYMPWLGFFHKLAMSDVFCLLDDVQFSSDDYIHRNQIKGPNGKIWLTIPVLTKKHLDKTINDTYIDNTKQWKHKHWNSMTMAYKKKAPYFESYEDFFENIYKKDWHKIVDIDIYILEYLLKELGISIKICKASDKKIEGVKSERILNMCNKLNADLYIFGEKGKDYVDESLFIKNDIPIYFQKYNHPTYPQLYGDFVSHMSILDLLFSFGEKSYGILTNNNPTKNDLIDKFIL